MMKAPFFRIPLLIISFLIAACTGSEPQHDTHKRAEVDSSKKAELIILNHDKPNAIRLAGPIRKLAGGLTFAEGPVWIPSGYLLFTDVPENTIYRWDEEKGKSVFMRPSGLDPVDAINSTYLGNAGANGLLLDNENRLLICQHGNRQVLRIEPDSSQTVLATQFRGKRFNSPNDIDVRQNGDLYFTDPPYGLPRGDADPAKELSFNGVYRLSGDEITLLDSTLTRPNGLAFSPDEKKLYVAVSDPKHKAWYQYDVNETGVLENKKLLYDATSETGAGLPDGMVVDAKGRIFATGPGGVWVFDDEGSLLGRIQPPERAANCTLGGEDGNTLFMAATTGIYAVEVE